MQLGNPNTLTLSDLIALQRLAEWVSHGSRVRWENGHGDILEGVARCFAHDGGGFPRDNEEIRDTYVHISGMFEHWLPVRHAMELVRDGLMGSAD